ncbi:MAG: family 16 glycosylhydrolase [Myxococcota bacterium]|nr:family 16 glycosylhydrolase [Myxococcota bacterium]
MMSWLGIALVGCSTPPSLEPPAPASGTDDTESPGTGPPTDTADPTPDSGTPEPGAELLVDPGFEDGDAAWAFWGGAERVMHDAQEGDWALRTTATNGAEQSLTGLKPNTTYQLSGWGRTTDSNHPLKIGVKDYGGEELGVLFEGPEYTQGSVTFTTGLGSTGATIYAYKHTGAQAGYADNLSLSEVGPSPYVLVWSDDFDGVGAPDDSRWTFESGFVRNEELQWYQEDNAYQEDGVLVIEGREEMRKNPGHDPTDSSWQSQRAWIEYTSSSITTSGRAQWQYGRIAVRAKVTNAGGTWPAIWTLGADCQWPSNGEVDIMENYSGSLLANFAWGTDTPWVASWDTQSVAVSSLGEDWTDDFHIWELHWTSEAMQIYLDGALLNDVSLSSTSNGAASCAGENPFQQPHYLLLNLALGSNGGSVDSLPFPTQYRVDYVRVYQTTAAD